ncbi:hypothetical protein TRFO_09215 [Tritrichomonas foetus]|uniref:Leucine Rich Repeat family protein n=1 Tax=Tritrichomonas foetus TaxID=1144522 RepID=A0A1J4JF23_9EUKA|nr:hypothetical protein TRFO_09215 [Tritrichomonas foetus]|eukprot:OHS97798.1 hypothetical protein TRFO_09215 [Tritrichomonas foetus]
MSKKSPDLTKFFDPSTENVVKTIWVQQIIQGGNYKNIFIAITDYFIRIYTETDGDIQQANAHKHLDIVGLDALDEITLRITFKSEIVTILADSSSNILQIIYSTVTKVLLPDEYPKCSPAINIKNIQNSRFIFSAIKMRYCALLAWQGNTPDKNVLSSLDRYVNKKSNFIDMGIISDYGFNVPVLLNAFQHQPLISTILIPHREKTDFYEYLIDFLPSSKTYKTLIIVETIPEKFEAMILAINPCQNLSLKCIEFLNVKEITSKTIAPIHKLIKDGHKLCLKFTNCFIPKCEKSLIQLMDKQKNLTGIHMTSVWLKDSVAIKTVALRLKNLSLRGCNIQISEILSILSKVPASKLKTLDLSNNSCITPINDKISFPITIRKVIMNHVNWIIRNFHKVFSLSCNANRDVTLSLSYATFQDRKLEDAMKEFFNLLGKTTSPTLSALYWNGFPTDQKFFQFLQKAINIKFVSFSDSQIKNVRYFQSFIESAKLLNTIDIHSLSDSKKINEIMKVVLKKSRTIQRLDISHNDINDQSFKKIVELLSSNNNIQQILLDDLKNVSFKEYQQFLNLLESRCTNLRVSFPRTDFNRFKEQKALNNDKIHKYHKLFNEPFADPAIQHSKEWENLILQEYQDIKIDDPIEPPQIVEDDEDSRHSIGSNHSSNSRHTPDKQALKILQAKGPPSLQKPVIKKKVKFDLVEIPQIDNDPVIQQFNNHYSINYLMKVLESITNQSNVA